jgi:DNA (cytosine-5)-methyltransferase 1
MTTPPSILSLFSGVGGIELGFREARNGHVIAVYEVWPAAQAVLRSQFPDVEHNHDVASLEDFHGADIVTAGFPCTDFSQAGRTAGIDGIASGLVRRILDTLTIEQPRWLLIENVPNMLHLGAGRAVCEIVDSLENHGYTWAYRVIDSRSFGLAQRRRRVYLLASTIHDPGTVLFGDDVGHAANRATSRTDAFGFSWTEGNRGVGWAQDAVPTIKGSTTVRVPSPPGVWLVDREAGSAIVTPSLRAVEVLQGFPAGWTSDAPLRDRWKLVGNAVSVPVARWIASRIRATEHGAEIAADSLSKEPLPDGSRWPRAAQGSGEKRWRIGVTEWPIGAGSGRQHLADVLDTFGCNPLSYRATRGFRDRLSRSALTRRHDVAFMTALNDHIHSMST